MKAIIKYQASDGAEFTDEVACERYEKLCKDVAETMARLPTPPDDTTFGNGDGYIQHHKETFLSVREALLRLAYKHSPHKFLKEAIEKPEECHPSWPGRIIDECCPRPINHAWSRVMCTSIKTWREYGQPYFANNENEAKTRCIAKGKKA